MTTPKRNEAVAFSKVKPTEEGAYYIRGFNLCRVEQYEALVLVRTHMYCGSTEEELVCNLHASTSEEDMDDWIPVADLQDDFEWSERLVPVSTFADELQAALTREAPTGGVSEALPIVAMLVEVAKAAHYAMDDCGDLVLTEEGAARLSNALDALDELPELDDGYVRDGWCKAKDHLAIALDTKVREQLAKRYEQEGFHGIAANLRGTQEAAPPVPQRHPDALPDGTLSKSTAKRVEALAASGGEDGWSLAMRVREALDRASCPDHFMRIAVETITGDAPQPPASASVSERAREIVPVGPDGGWCTRCGCGNDAANFAHLPSCNAKTPDAAARAREILIGLNQGFIGCKRDNEIITKGNAYDVFVRGDTALRAIEQALTQQRGECEASVSVKQKWPKRHQFPKPDEHGNETGSIGEHAYAEGWNACLDEAKRMSGVPMPLKGKKGVVVVEDTTPQPSADAVRELVQRWRDRALDPTNRGFDNACSKCADELESLLSAASGEKGVG